MPTTLTTEVVEQSSVVVRVQCKDEAGNGVIPTTALWSLVDEDGDIVNSREDVELTPAEDMYIALSGDDLKIVDTTRVKEPRTVIVESTYASYYTGSTLNLKDSCTFDVYNIKKVV